MPVKARWITDGRIDAAGVFYATVDICLCGACGTPFGITTNRRRYVLRQVDPADSRRAAVDPAEIRMEFAFLQYHCVDVHGTGHFEKTRAPRRPADRPDDARLVPPILDAAKRLGLAVVNRVPYGLVKSFTCPNPACGATNIL